MKTSIPRNARPQAMTLLAASAISIVLWFVPFAEVVTYPFRIFVTFIHEGGHAIVAVLTGDSVESLRIAVNASGETYSTKGGLFSQVLVASAGYVGAMTYGALLLILIRKAVSARLVLLASAGLIFGLTLIYGLFKPVMSGNTLTFLAGAFLSVGLVAVAKFASPRAGSFFVCFLAVQCVMNALLDLKTVFFLSSSFAPTVPTDALNMATATGIPALLWTVIWIAIAFAILGAAIRGFVAEDANLTP